MGQSLCRRCHRRLLIGGLVQPDALDLAEMAEERRKRTELRVQMNMEAVRTDRLDQVSLNNTELALQDLAEHLRYLLAKPLNELHVSFALQRAGDEGLALVAEALQKSAVTVLDASNNKIGVQGMRHLVKGLEGSKLTRLSLNNNAFGSEGIRLFSKVLQATSIKDLELDSIQLGSEGAAALAASLPGSSVTRLSLVHTSLGVEGGQSLGLGLKGTSITELNLNGNSIGAAGMKGLAEGLRGLPLTHLHLSRNAIGDEGLKHLAEALRSTPSLTSMNLNSNNIGLAGMQAFAPALKQSSMRLLMLDRNKALYPEGIQLLASVLPETGLVHLCADYRDGPGPDGLAVYTDEGIFRALLEGARNSSITLMSIGQTRDQALYRQAMQVGNANKEKMRLRTFVLQMEVKGSASHPELTFRTLAGELAGRVSWSPEQFVQELPEAVLRAMPRAGFQPPFRLHPLNLKLVRADGSLLDTGVEARPLEEQLAPAAASKLA